MNTYEQMKQIIAEECDCHMSFIKDDALVRDVPDMDSLVTSAIIMKIEEEFATEIPYDANFRADVTVREFIEGIQEYLSCNKYIQSA